MKRTPTLLLTGLLALLSACGQQTASTPQASTGTTPIAQAPNQSQVRAQSLLTVTNTNDSGDGSLRQAIVQANASAGADMITFQSGLTGTLTLTSGELVISDDVTITGPGASTLTISGNNASRVFFVNPGAPSGPPSSSLTVKITGLTLANGLAKGGDGGVAVYAGGSGGAAGLGGAVFVNNGNLTVSGVAFSGNRAQGGNAGGGGASANGGAGGGGVGGNGGGARLAGGGGGPSGALGGNGGAGGAWGEIDSGAPGGSGGNGGDGAGGGGGGRGSDCPGIPSCTGPGGNGGDGGGGGFGGGGGGGGHSGYTLTSSTGGRGGTGGFGGGGGGGAGGPGDLNQPGGTGGSFGGAGGAGRDNYGGGGGGAAGLGGAIFVRAGSLALQNSRFTGNTATGGAGGAGDAGAPSGTAGQGKGGAIFLLSPATLSGCGTTLSGNTAANAAGNGTDTNDVYGGTASVVSCDRTLPTVTLTTPTPDATYTQNQMVNADYTCQDEAGGSGIARCEGTVENGTPVPTGALGSQTFTVTATDKAGNQAVKTVTYTVAAPADTTPPDITPTVTGTQGQNGWYIGPVTVSWSVTDPDSTVTSSNGCGPVTLSTDTAGTTLTCEATSAGGKGSQAVTVKIDLTAPTLNPVVSPNPVLLRGMATVTAGADDTLSGVDSSSCEALDTGTVGPKNVSCTATDKAGNTTKANASYGVIYDFKGFFFPVQNAPALNRVKAGFVVPLSFTLGGNFGTGAIRQAVSLPINCSTLAPLGGASTAGEVAQQVDRSAQSAEQAASGWTTDASPAGAMQAQALTPLYVYLWGTQKAWKNTCRQFILTLNDGTDHQANFRFE